MHVLITTGGSPHAGIALYLGAEIARLTGDTPTVISVAKREIDRPRAEQALARAREFLQPEFPKAPMRLRMGHPAEEIIREAEEGRYDLVIVGERQHRDLVSRFLLGSTAERVIEHAACPVMIAKGEIGPIRRLLLCDSGAQPSLLDRLTARLIDLIRSDVDITVLHVMSQISAGPAVPGELQLRASAEELIEEHAPEGEIFERDLRILEQKAHLHPHPKVRHGLVVEEILDETRVGNYDLLVIGAHRKEGWSQFLLDDLARQIIARADRPVLVVR